MSNNFLSSKRWNLQIGVIVSAVAVLAGLAVAPLGASAARKPDLGIIEFVTPQGTSAVHLGTSARALRKRGLIGPLRRGCELDPGQRVAKLRSRPGTPAKGTAVFGGPSGKKLTSLTIVGGAMTRKNINIGASPEAVLAAYPHAVYEAPGTHPPFADGFIWVNSVSQPKMTFVIAAESEKVSAISVPSPNFCE